MKSLITNNSQQHIPTKKTNPSSLNSTALYSKGQLNTQNAKKGPNHPNLPVYSQAQINTSQTSLTSKQFTPNLPKFTKVQTHPAAESIFGGIKEFDTKPNQIPLKQSKNDTPGLARQEGESKSKVLSDCEQRKQSS